MHCCNYVTRVSRLYYVYILPPLVVRLQISGLARNRRRLCQVVRERVIELQGVYYVNCLFIITNKYSIIVGSALYLVLNYNVYKLDCSILLILLLQV